MMTRTVLLIVCAIHTSAALQFSPAPLGRRAALTSVLPLIAAGARPARAITEYAKKDFKDGVYVGPSVVGAAPTIEGEEKLEELYLEALAKKEKTVQAMGFELDDNDRKDTEMLLRTQYCGFQAKLKCKASPAAKNGGR
jgi:hypothetical protein